VTLELGKMSPNTVPFISIQALVQILEGAATGYEKGGGLGSFEQPIRKKTGNVIMHKRQCLKLMCLKNEGIIELISR
jgi:hypothetical protein